MSKRLCLGEGSASRLTHRRLRDLWPEATQRRSHKQIKLKEAAIAASFSYCGNLAQLPNKPCGTKLPRFWLKSTAMRPFWMPTDFTCSTPMTLAMAGSIL